MQISTKFTIAVHLLTVVAYFSESQKVTSDFLAGSIGSNPVIIRNIMGQLKEAGLIDRSVIGAEIEGKTVDRAVSRWRKSSQIFRFWIFIKQWRPTARKCCSVSMRIQILSVQSAERFTRALMGHWKRFRRTLK